MFSIVLDVVIGLVFIYLLYSLLTTSIQEAVATILHRRANTLYKGIKTMLTDTEPSQGALVDFFSYVFVGIWVELWGKITSLVIVQQANTLYKSFYNHPIIKNYGQNLLFKKPSYLTAENFSSILIETIKNVDPANQNSTATFAMLQNVLANPEAQIDQETRNILTYHMNEAAGDLDVFKFRLAKWYDDTMDRVSGWYKRNTQFWLFGIGIVLAIMLNLDSIEIATYLSDNKTAREQLAQMGVAAAGNQNLSGKDSAIAQEVMDSIKADLKTVNTLVGLGWGDYGRSDPNFRKYCLDGAACSSLREAYNKNKDTITEAVENSITAAQDSVKNAKFSKEDTVRYTGLIKRTGKRSDSARAKEAANMLQAVTNKKLRYQKIADSLQKNKQYIIDQSAFAALYDSDDFDNYLGRKYVLCYRLWTFRKWLGFLITAFAISLGSPFWFDLLNKFVSLRSSVKSVNSSGSTTKNNDSGNTEIDG